MYGLNDVWPIAARTLVVEREEGKADAERDTDATEQGEAGARIKVDVQE